MLEIIFRLCRFALMWVGLISIYMTTLFLCGAEELSNFTSFLICIASLLIAGLVEYCAAYK